MTAPQKLTEAAMARELGGVSRQAVHDLVKRGIIQKDADGLIDVEAAKKALLDKVRPSGKAAGSIKQPETPAESAPSSPEAEGVEVTSYHIAKTLREAAEAQIAKHKLGVLQDRYVEREAVEREAFSKARNIRDRIMGLPTKIAPLLAPVTDPFEVERMLREALRQVLSECLTAAKPKEGG